MENISATTQYKCEICEKAFKKNNGLSQHFKMFIILIYITSLLLKGDFYSSASATASLGNTSSWLSPSSSQSHAVAATHVLKLNENIPTVDNSGCEIRAAFKVWDNTPF